MVVYDILNNFKKVTNDWEINKSHYWILIHVKELYMIKHILALDEESIAECIDDRQPSKISFFDGYTFLVLNILNYDKETVYSKELNIFLSKNYIITVYKEDLDIFKELINDIRNSRNCFILKERPQPCILFYYILDRIIVRNYDVISCFETEADRIEIRILKNPNHEQVDDLIHLRRQMYKIKKYLNPLRYIGDSLESNDNSIIEIANLRYFFNLNIKIDKLMLALETLVQDLALVREAFESEIANKTNELMKVFTLIATIFLPLNLISSMYGMNVKHIPFMSIDYGYYYVLIIMFIVAIYLLYKFKKKRWL